MSESLSQRPASVDLIAEPGALPLHAVGLTRLDALGLLRVHGADAASFLQGQLTQDIKSVSADAVRLAGYCTPKGRLLATFWVWTTPDLSDGFWLACSRDVAAAVAKRLSMFVLRAKAKVEDVSDAFAVVGLIAARPLDARAGAAAASPSALPAGLPRLPRLALDAALSGASPLQVERALTAIPRSALDAAWADWQRAGFQEVSPTVWSRFEVLSGIARVTLQSQEHFVPQMVNLERVDGVSFRKGCYPGQEIVARSQYLGKLKRRLFLGIGDGEPPLPGTDVVGSTAAPGDEPIGEVVLAAASAVPGRYFVQFEARLDGVATDGDVAVRIAGQPVRLLPLPYPLEDPAAA